jgi:methionyl-tRNA formyltransferase
MVPVMFLKVINKLKENPNFILERQSKNLNDALRCYPRNSEDGRIDWARPREEIRRLINASGPPFKGAFCFINEQKIHIYECEISDDDEIYSAVPGQILKIEEKKITVATGNGKLMISDLYFDNNQIKISDFFRSIRQRLN